MPDYRRNRVAGGTYFFTVNLLERNSHPRGGRSPNAAISSKHELA